MANTPVNPFLPALVDQGGNLGLEGVGGRLVLFCIQPYLDYGEHIILTDKSRVTKCVYSKKLLP